MKARLYLGNDVAELEVGTEEIVDLFYAIQDFAEEQKEDAAFAEDNNPTQWWEDSGNAVSASEVIAEKQAQGEEVNEWQDLGIAKSIDFSGPITYHFDGIPIKWAADFDISGPSGDSAELWRPEVEEDELEIDDYDEAWKNILAEKFRGSVGLKELCNRAGFGYEEIESIVGGLDDAFVDGQLLAKTSNVVAFAVAFGFETPGEFLDYVLEAQIEKVENER